MIGQQRRGDIIAQGTPVHSRELGTKGGVRWWNSIEARWNFHLMAEKDSSGWCQWSTKRGEPKESDVDILQLTVPRLHISLRRCAVRHWWQDICSMGRPGIGLRWIITDGMRGEQKVRGNIL